MLNTKIISKDPARAGVKSRFLSGKKTIYLFIALLFAGTVSMAQTQCQASFTYQVSGLTVSFTDASTSIFTITSWQWNFGDNTTSSVQNPTHTYSASGTYNVCLTITDSYGCHSTTCHNVTVGVPHPCQASFTYTVDSTGMTYYFTNTSTGTTSTTIYTWDFGDNTTSNLENPTHTYTTTGHSMVCVYILQMPLPDATRIIAFPFTLLIFIITIIILSLIINIILNTHITTTHIITLSRIINIILNTHITTLLIIILIKHSCLRKSVMRI